MQGKKVLVIEDDPLIRKSIEVTFKRAGSVVRSASNGQEGLREFFQFRPDLVTLDLMMPHIDGWETCRQIRQLADIPIIMLTAIRDEDAIVRALDMGAVDFVNKPFSPKVLLARARAALRKSPIYGVKEPPAGFIDDYLSVDSVTRRVLVRGKQVKLTKTEYELLAYLVNNRNCVMTFDQILDNVWGPGYEGTSDYVHVYVSRLRQKIESDPREPVYLKSEHGVGYRFESLI